MGCSSLRTTIIILLCGTIFTLRQLWSSYRRVIFELRTQERMYLGFWPAASLLVKRWFCQHVKSFYIFENVYLSCVRFSYHNCSKVNTTSTHSEKRRNYNSRSAIMQPYGIQLTGWREMTTLMIRFSAFLLKSSFPVMYYTIWALEHMRESPTLLEVVAAENFVASLHSAISQLLDLVRKLVI